MDSHAKFTTLKGLFLKTTNNEYIILSAKTEGLAHDCIDLRFARLIRYIVQIQRRIRVIQVHCHRQGIFFDGLNAGDQLCTTGRPDQMTELAFRTAVRYIFRVIGEDRFDR